jgi:hypothetical protein
MAATPSGTTSLPMPSPAMTATRYLAGMRFLRVAAGA